MPTALNGVTPSKAARKLQVLRLPCPSGTSVLPKCRVEAVEGAALRPEGQILTTFTHSQQFFKHRCFSDYPYQFVFCQRQGFPTLPRLASCSPLALASQVAYATTPSSGLADLNWPYPQVCPQHFSLLHSPVYPFWEINDSPNFIYQPPHFYPKLHSRGTRHTWCLAQGLAHVNVSHTNRNLAN